MNVKREEKILGGTVIEVKEIQRGGVPVGIVEGYIATWDIDRGDWTGVKDQFVKGAFLSSILDHKVRGRQIRLKDHHGRTVGGFPVEQVREDERGLYGVGEINLEVQQGREAYSLAKQGVLTDFSIGFSVVKSTTDETGELRTISEASIWEGSIVDEPMNPKANITAVKSGFDDLPVAPKDTEWNEEKALSRVEGFINVSDIKESLGTVFAKGSVAGFLIVDVIDEKLVVIPKAIFLASSSVEKMDDGEAKDKAVNHLEKYYAKMNLPSPFAEEQKQFFNVDEVKGFTTRQFEKALVKTGCFSKEAAKFLVSKADLRGPKEKQDDEAKSKILKEIEDIASLYRKK